MVGPFGDQPPSLRLSKSSAISYLISIQRYSNHWNSKSFRNSVSGHEDRDQIYVILLYHISSNKDSDKRTESSLQENRQRSWVQVYEKQAQTEKSRWAIKKAKKIRQPCPSVPSVRDMTEFRLGAMKSTLSSPEIEPEWQASKERTSRFESIPHLLGFCSS